MRLHNKVGEFATVLAVVAAGAWLYWNTYTFFPSLLPGYPGDAFFPRLALVFLFIVAGIFLLRRIVGFFRTRNGGKTEIAETIDFPFLHFALMIALVWAYILALPGIGFEISTVVFMTVLMAPRLKGGRARRWLVAAAIALATMLFLYAAFIIALNVNLPLKILPWITL